VSRIAVVGAGAVGAAVARMAGDRGHEVVGLADSTGAVVDADGIDAEATLERKRETGSAGDRAVGALLEADYDVLVEATPTTLGDAEPGFGHTKRALERDRDVVLANKGPVAERYGELQALAEASAGRLLFGATVGGAIPVLSTVREFGVGDVDAVRGVLNGTTNFVLSRMAAEGLGYDHVLAEAQDLGVAEADPSFDVEGTDAALKFVILANVLADGDREFSLSDAAVEGITELPGSALELAGEDGRTVRLIGEATRESVEVAPRLVPENGPLSVSGTRNIVQIETRTAGRLHVSGRGAGGEETAAAVLADVDRLDPR
jgi:homoserine dehydrogenase